MTSIFLCSITVWRTDKNRFFSHDEIDTLSNFRLRASYICLWERLKLCKTGKLSPKLLHTIIMKSLIPMRVSTFMVFSIEIMVEIRSGDHRRCRYWTTRFCCFLSQLATVHLLQGNLLWARCSELFMSYKSSQGLKRTVAHNGFYTHLINLVWILRIKDCLVWVD